MIGLLWKGKDKNKDKDHKKEQQQEQQVDQDQLKKQGFNPEGLQIQQAKQYQDYQGFIDHTPQQLHQIINKLKFFLNEDEPRHQFGHAKGGKICGDQKVASKIRSIGKQMIKLIGKNIISGDLNLTRVSFPIKAMVPKTALQNSTLSCCTLPYYMTKACQQKNPLQKMKYVLTTIVSSAYYMNLFLKPLNPVIGQTLQASYADGTQIYCQQISHHPPISYFLAVGPNNSYRYAGYYAFQANAGLNSMTLTNKGRRWFQFADGTRIDVNFNKQIYCGVFMGSLRSEAVGNLILKDEKNNIQCQVKYGKMKKKPSDYFQGSINQNGKTVSKFYGTYCGLLTLTMQDIGMVDQSKVQKQDYNKNLYNLILEIDQIYKNQKQVIYNQHNNKNKKYKNFKEEMLNQDKYISNNEVLNKDDLYMRGIKFILKICIILFSNQSKKYVIINH